MLKSPEFWYQTEKTWLSSLLQPVARFYESLSKKRYKKRSKKAYRSSCHVICVGNLNMGGSGKTPVVQALLEMMNNRQPYILSRGYGGDMAGPMLVEPDMHDAFDVGDEALMHANYALCGISRNRKLGARFLEQAGADIIIMDDGFQNPDLVKDLSFIVVDGAHRFGNNQIFPAGPLRENVEQGLKRADAVILIGNNKGDEEIDVGNLPVFKAELKPDKISKRLKQAKSVIGFAGIGHPLKFRETLNDLGLSVSAFYGFADHHPYSTKDLDFLLKEADEKSAVLVTTEKDKMRLPATYQERIEVVSVKLVFEDMPAIEKFVKKRI